MSRSKIRTVWNLSWLCTMCVFGLAFSVKSQAEIPTPTYTGWVATSPGLPNAIAVSSNPIRYSLDGGWFWRSSSSADKRLVGIAPRSGPNQPIRIMAASYSTIYRTGDFGLSWAEYTFPTPSVPHWLGPWVNPIHPSPVDPNRLYVQVTYSESEYGSWMCDLYTSPDAGISWQYIGDCSDFSGSDVIPSPVLAGRVYRFAGHYWHQSDDAGSTWITTTFGFSSDPYLAPDLYLALDAQDPLRLYSTGDNIEAIWTGRRSTDGGTNWVQWGQFPCSFLNTHPARVQLLAHPTLSNVLLLWCNNYSAVEDATYRSLDGGDHWEFLFSEESITWPPLVADYGRAGRLLRARRDGLWATDDAGLHWYHLTANYQSPPPAVFLPMALR